MKTNNPSNKFTEVKHYRSTVETQPLEWVGTSFTISVDCLVYTVVLYQSLVPCPLSFYNFSYFMYVMLNDIKGIQEEEDNLQHHRKYPWSNISLLIVSLAQ